MRAYNLLSAVTFAVALQAGITQAQTLNSDDGPAETPPPGYSDRQYIDSRGCVYVRAGFGGQVQWIPRVSRDREVLCGFKPTFAAAPEPPAPEPVAQAAPTQQAPVPKRENARQSVVQDARGDMPARPAQRPAIAAAAAKDACGAAEILSARYVRDGAAVAVRCGPTPAPSSPARRPAPAQEARPEPPRATVEAAAPERDPRDAWQAALAGNACGGGQLLSARYMDIGNAIDVRCGPKPQPVGTTPPPDPLSLTVTQANPPAPAGVSIPDGYQAAWPDGRLNPNRAQGTPAGETAMRRVWTDTVPRQLVAAHRAVRSGAPAPARAMSTKTMPASGSAAGQSFIQIGVFGDESNVRRAVARLRGAGLPVDVSVLASGDGALQRVQVGPLGPGDNIQAALAAARVAGYRDAFLRR